MLNFGCFYDYSYFLNIRISHSFCRNSVARTGWVGVEGMAKVIVGISQLALGLEVLVATSKVAKTRGRITCTI